MKRRQCCASCAHRAAPPAGAALLSQLQATAQTPRDDSATRSTASAEHLGGPVVEFRDRRDGRFVRVLGTVDVVVEVEGGQDEDPGGGGVRVGSDRPGGLDSVEDMRSKSPSPGTGLGSAS